MGVGEMFCTASLVRERGSCAWNKQGEGTRVVLVEDGRRRPRSCAVLDERMLSVYGS